MLFVILSGEAIFMLPFLVPRLYRPTMLEAWGLTNTDIGAAFTAYGLSAMVSYFIGGPFADKFSARKLITTSLVITGLAGLPLMFSPSKTTLVVTYFFFGISTILLMWGALIKSTHTFGGEDRRSTAMGILDSGRGFFAAFMSSFLLILLSFFLSEDSLVTQGAESLTVIYLVVMCFLFLVAAGVWISFDENEESKISSEQWDLDKALNVMKSPQVWLLSIIIFSAYCGYKSVDNYSIYMVDRLGISAEKSAFYMSIVFWLRPISALVSGFFADWLHTKIKLGRFYLMNISLFIGAFTQVYIAFNPANILFLAISAIALSACFTFSLRAIYFSIFGDLKIPQHLVGTAVGIVSFVGFLPDVFFNYLTGYMIDNYQNGQGYTYSFLLAASLFLLGFLANTALLWISKKKLSTTE